MLDLDPIKERLAKRTPGKWGQYVNDINYDCGVISEHGHICRIDAATDSETDTKRGPSGRLADSDLIAHAPADLEKLIAEVERLRKIVNALAEHDVWTLQKVNMNDRGTFRCDLCLAVVKPDREEHHNEGCPYAMAKEYRNA